MLFPDLPLPPLSLFERRELPHLPVQDNERTLYRQEAAAAAAGPFPETTTTVRDAQAIASSSSTVTASVAWQAMETAGGPALKSVQWASFTGQVFGKRVEAGPSLAAARSLVHCPLSTSATATHPARAVFFESSSTTKEA